MTDPDFYKVAFGVGLVGASFAILVKTGVLELSGLSKLFTPPYRRQPILTDNEAHFIRVLERAVPEHRVYPQVSFGAFLKVKSGLDASSRTTAFNKISSKRADFVICDQRHHALVLIELDDRTHNAEKDALRDRYTAAAGLPTLRYQSRSKPDAAVVRRDILHAISKSGIADGH